jgi:hypothetical protein
MVAAQLFSLHVLSSAMESKELGEEEQQYCSAQSSIYHNYCLGDNDSHSGHVSTVPGTFLEQPRQGIHNQGTPRNDS